MSENLNMNSFWENNDGLFWVQNVEPKCGLNIILRPSCRNLNSPLHSSRIYFDSSSVSLWFSSIRDLLTCCQLTPHLNSSEFILSSSSSSSLITAMLGYVVKISARTNGGPRSPSEHAWHVRSSPHQHKHKFSGALVCKVTFKHLLKPLRRHIQSFGTLGQLFKRPPLSAQIYHSAGGWGRGIGILIFCDLGAHAKFQKLAAFVLVEK
jgi:hypothetical protein